MRNLFIPSVVCALMFGSLAAHAVPIVASGYGKFTNLHDCDDSRRNCSSVNGSNTQVHGGSTSSHGGYVNPSKLTAADLGIKAYKGIAMSNLRYSVYDAPGGGRSTFINNVWYNEKKTSSMYSPADFRSRSTSVPEPTTLSLLGLGLLVVAGRTRRRTR